MSKLKALAHLFSVYNVLVSINNQGITQNLEEFMLALPCWLHNEDIRRQRGNLTDPPGLINLFGFLDMYTASVYYSNLIFF